MLLLLYIIFNYLEVNQIEIILILKKNVNHYFEESGINYAFTSDSIVIYQLDVIRFIVLTTINKVNEKIRIRALI